MADLTEVLRRIDELNAEDPNDDEVGGELVAKELLYSRRMSERLGAYCPEAGDELQIAARAQHVCRWRIPRADYPEGLGGYKKWKSTLAKMHADIAAEIMLECGYSEEQAAHVRGMIQKHRLSSDEESQILQDVVCLVFFEHYAAEFAARHSPAAVTTIVAKTLDRMSERGREAAKPYVDKLA
jgi:hypothetical protein